MPFLKRRHVPQTPETEIRISPIESASHLPEDLWRIIISFVVCTPGTGSVHLPSPFSPHQEEPMYRAIETSLAADRKSLKLVSRFWRSAVEEAEVECVVTDNADGFATALAYLDGKGQGDRAKWTRRLEVRAFNHVLPANLNKLERVLSVTPNLQILILHDDHCNPTNVRPLPKDVIRAIGRHSKSLKRLELRGEVYPPRFSDLAALCSSLPNLTTLHLHAIYSYTTPPLDERPRLFITLPGLRTLRLAEIPMGFRGQPSFALVWDPFLSYLSLRDDQLPSLERFECDTFPRGSLEFFNKHGHKIKHFRTEAWTTDNLLPRVLACCPMLDSLVLVHGALTIDIPAGTHHPRLRRICITPPTDLAVNVPTMLRRHAVLLPLGATLQTVFQMDVPCLEEVWIRDAGLLEGVFEDHSGVIKMRDWGQRYRSKRVKLCNKMGHPLVT